MDLHDDNTATELDHLVSKAAEGAATRAEWALLEDRASREPGLWRRIALSQREARDLEQLCSAVAAGSRTEVDDVVATVTPAGRSQGRLRVWGGWAAAALLALVLIPRTLRPGNAPAAGESLPAPQTAGLMPFANAEEAYKAYLDQGKAEGRILAQAPSRMLRAVEMPGGEGYEVYFVRQVVERVDARQLMKYATDEAGRMVPVPYVPDTARAPTPARTRAKGRGV